LEIFSASLPDNHPYIAAAHRSLGITLSELHRNVEAEQEIRRSLDIYSTSLPAGSTQILIVKGALGRVFTVSKRYSEAEPLLLDNYRLLHASLGETNPAVLRMHGWIEALYSDMGKPEQAERFFASLSTAPVNAKQ
jgi:hypothetical protein